MIQNWTRRISAIVVSLPRLLAAMVTASKFSSQNSTLGSRAARIRRLARRKTRRQLWLTAHLYLGLLIGADLALVGITGSLLVFYKEIDAWLNPTLLTVAAPSEGITSYRPLTEIIAAGEAVAPPGTWLNSVSAPTHSSAVYTLAVLQATTTPDQFNHYEIFVNPYTARVTGLRLAQRADEWVPHTFIGVVFALHYALLLGDSGVTVVGLCGVGLMISVLTGLIVWWPLTGEWRKAFSIKWKSTPLRLIYDLHKTAGVSSCLVLLAVLLSGVSMNLPTQFLWLVQQCSPATRGEADAPISTPRASMTPIGIERAVAIAEQRYPGGRLNWLALPDDDTGVYTISYKDVPQLSHFWSERQVSINQYSGVVLDVRAPDTRRSAGEAFLDWQWPLHSGQAFGMSGRILVFLCGLACPVLYFTGLIRWRLKQRIKQFHAARVQHLLNSPRETIL